MRELISNEKHVTDPNYRKGSLCPNKKKVAKQKKYK